MERNFPEHTEFDRSFERSRTNAKDHRTHYPELRLKDTQGYGFWMKKAFALEALLIKFISAVKVNAEARGWIMCKSTMHCETCRTREDKSI